MRDNTIQIAVVDDGINEQYFADCHLNYNIEITKELSVKNRSSYNKRLYSHGSICAAIIQGYAPQACISSIKILSKNKTTDIKRLIKAIEWCTEHAIDIINLSLGTVYYKDFCILKAAVAQAIRKGVLIIAASSNANRLTYPAYLTDVIGVKCDRTNALSEGQHLYHCFPNDGINITANSIIPIQTINKKEKETEVCNSYAAAVITARVYEILSSTKNRSLPEIHRRLAAGAVNSTDYNAASQYLKKEIDWVQNAMVFDFNEIKTDPTKYYTFHVVDRLNLEAGSTDQLLKDIQYCLSKQSGIFDTIVIDINEAKETSLDSSKLISALLPYHKNIVCLDNRAADKSLALKSAGDDLKIWHPSIVQLLDIPYHVKGNSPIITLHDLTNGNLIPVMLSLQQAFQRDGYYCISMADQCLGKLSGFEYIPVNNSAQKTKAAASIEFISGYYNPDIMLIGLSSVNSGIEIIDQSPEVDISIIITETPDRDVLNFIHTCTARKYIEISSDKEASKDLPQVKLFDFSVINQIQELYQYIRHLYEEA